MVFVSEGFPDEESIKMEGKETVRLTRLVICQVSQDINCCKLRKIDVELLKSPGLLL